MKRVSFLIVLFAALLVGTLNAQLTDSSKELQALRSAIAQRTDELGSCNTERGDLQRLSAQVLSGKLQDVATVLANVRATVAKENPGKLLDDKWKILDTPVAAPHVSPVDKK